MKTTEIKQGYYGKMAKQDIRQHNEDCSMILQKKEEKNMTTEKQSNATKFVVIIKKYIYKRNVIKALKIITKLQCSFLATLGNAKSNSTQASSSANSLQAPNTFSPANNTKIKNVSVVIVFVFVKFLENIKNEKYDRMKRSTEPFFFVVLSCPKKKKKKWQ